jgi:hypothetical protein
MSSQPRTAREEERRLNIRTLVIASIASAAAAVITSQFWIQGTWVAAALTPVIVTLVSELLNRPTEAIAQRVTSRGMDVLPEAGAAAPPPRERERPRAERAPAEPPERAPADPGSEAGPAAPPVRVYRAGANGKSLRPRTRRQKVAVGMVALTAVLAFAIAAVAITGAELVSGGSIGKGGRDTTLFGGDSKQPTDKRTEESQPAQPESTQPEEGESGSGGQETQPQQEPSQPEEEPPPESQPPPAPKEAPEAPAPQQ